jgi:hypothetical protein
VRSAMGVADGVRCDQGTTGGVRRGSDGDGGMEGDGDAWANFSSLTAYFMKSTGF